MNIYSQMFTADAAAIEYKKVVTPKFSFKYNKFLKFDFLLLNMPGTQNVPIGDIEIADNNIPCDCDMVKVRGNLQGVMILNNLLSL